MAPTLPTIALNWAKRPNFWANRPESGSRLLPITNRALSPNQLDKRSQIIDAAKVVLLRDGLAGCTTRAVADASPLTRSAIHYYFNSAHEIIDAAMDSHLEDFIAGIRAAASGLTDPAERFWATVDSYRRHFEGQPRLAVLWFDYSIQSISRGELKSSRRIDEAIHDVLRERLEDVGVSDPAERSRALLAYMIGSTMRQLFTKISRAQARAELATLSSVPAP
jgi:AcrR family transcriptional regulator